MSVYICRHEDRQSIHPMSALSQMGKTNAMALGQALASNGMREPCILSSPYERCLETATAISQTVGRVPILVEYGLSEGPLPQGVVGVCASQIQQRFALLDTTYQSKTPLPNHEDTQRQTGVALRLFPSTCTKPHNPSTCPSFPTTAPAPIPINFSIL